LHRIFNVASVSAVTRADIVMLVLSVIRVSGIRINISLVLECAVVWERSPYGVGPTNGGGGVRPYDYTSLKRPRIDGSMMVGPSMHSSPMMNNYAPPPPYEHPQAAAFELQQCRQMITELKRVRAGTRACFTQIVTGKSGASGVGR
jgi:hypothetical protein